MPARIVAPTPETIGLAAAALARGELVGLPTETVYGLGAHAFDGAAVARVFAVKERPTFDPLIVHVQAPEGAVAPLAQLRAQGVVDDGPLSATARGRVDALGRAFWPGPLTLVLPRHARVPDLVSSGLATVAVRMPRHPVAQALLRATGFPLAAPSANRFGRISPTSAADVARELGDRIDLILDGGRSEVGVESTVVALAPDGTASLLRPGGVTKERVEACLGVALLVPTFGSAPVSPGMLASHYAPRKPLVLLEGPLGTLDAKAFRRGARVGLLAQTGDAAAWKSRVEGLTAAPATVEVLSPGGDLHEAARNLFASLRRLDESEAELLIAEPCPSEHGLGHAIADRLRRAAAKAD